MVQLYVSQLRKLLADEGGTEIVTHGRGYELRLDPEAVDAARFERLMARPRVRTGTAARGTPHTGRWRSGADRRSRNSWTSRSLAPRHGVWRSSA